MEQSIPKTSAQLREEARLARLTEASQRMVENKTRTVTRVMDLRMRNEITPTDSKRILSEIRKNAKAPHRFSEFHVDGRIDHGMSELARSKTGVGGYASRFVGSVNPFSAPNRANLMNSMGLITRDQRLGMKLNPSVMGSAGMLALPVANAIGLIETLSSGGNALDFVGNYMVPSYLLGYGFRAGKSLGYTGGSAVNSVANGIASMVGKSAMPFGPRALAGIGGTLGLASGLGLSYLGLQLGETISSLGRPSNALRTMTAGMLARESTTQSFSSEESMTLRQKSLEKLSKSGLNDRGTILGNEASILRGVM